MVNDWLFPEPNENNLEGELIRSQRSQGARICAATPASGLL
jgi:hypothetical protein